MQSAMDGCWAWTAKEATIRQNNCAAAVHIFGLGLMILVFTVIFALQNNCFEFNNSFVLGQTEPCSLPLF